ncbi:hypothetical protein WICMUC_002227 [Wickerhamomyces mucosus]|uniref:3-oxoacyl-[acyl-carrier-protein] synthase n=1 Tax=Wickerhamomyces mucosus TaxID=1378264 RepID=A0A9P8TEI4_9ASCO|nr:hypothetical protein WICMUC_002227 [Wickerhamomyces mucosus]
MATKRVVVTGLGLVSPLGVGVTHSWSNLIAGVSGIVSTSTLNDERYNDIPSKVVGAIPLGSKSEGKWKLEEHLDKTEIRRTSKFSHYALAATHEALTDANWFPDTLEDQLNTGVCIGSGIGGFTETYDNTIAFHNGGFRKIQPLFIPKLLPNMSAGLVSIKYGLKGPNHSVSTACATGNHAIGDAYRFIKDGYADVIVAGATEASVHPLSLAGFARAKSLSTKFNHDPSKASRPFDANRDGFVLSEGAGIVVLESLEHANARNSSIYAEVVGYGLSGDGYHITSPSPDGLGALRSMELALRGIDRKDVGYVNAHATSTNVGDRIESLAIRTIFKENPNVLVSSTKGSTGHLLGAAGSTESIFTILALKHGIAPPTLNLTTPGGAEGDVSDYFNLNFVANNSIQSDINYAISNSFGFGGVNTTLAFKKYEA